MRVFLIHGMGRSSVSMAWLARRLQRGGHAPSSFGYSVAARSIDRIADDYVRHAERTLDETGGGPYAVVGHSLGNVITRYASPRLPAGFARFAMLAPPNRSPALARAMGGSPVFRRLTGDAGRRLGDRAFFVDLPVPDVDILVIAGAQSPPWLPHRGAPSDGIVAIDETHLPGARHEVVDASHSFIMNHPRVTELLLDFLNQPL